MVLGEFFAEASRSEFYSEYSLIKILPSGSSHALTEGSSRYWADSAETIRNLRVDLLVWFPRIGNLYAYVLSRLVCAKWFRVGRHEALARRG
jgi:hypothetical protein